MMGKTVNVTCDGCGRDLTTRSNSVDYRLVVAAESKPGYGAGAYTDMMIYPPVDRAYYFCGLGCLDHWRGRERHRDALRRERSDAWASEHGTKDDTGRVRSYRCPPQEILDTWRTECEAAALAAFPRQSLYNWKSGSTGIKSQNLARLGELKVAAQVLLTEGVSASPLVIERKLPGGKTMLEAIAEGADGRIVATSLVNMLRDEAEQQRMMEERFAVRVAAAPRTSDYGVPSFDERG